MESEYRLPTRLPGTDLFMFPSALQFLNLDYCALYLTPSNSSLTPKL